LTDNRYQSAIIILHWTACLSYHQNRRDEELTGALVWTGQRQQHGWQQTYHKCSSHVDWSYRHVNFWHNVSQADGVMVTRIYQTKQILRRLQKNLT